MLFQINIFDSPVSGSARTGRTAWLAQLSSRTHPNVTAVALANKLARISWAVLAKNEPYRAAVSTNAIVT